MGLSSDQTEAPCHSRYGSSVPLTFARGDVNGAVFLMRPLKPRPSVTAGIAQQILNLKLQPFIGNGDVLIWGKYSCTWPNNINAQSIMMTCKEYRFRVCLNFVKSHNCMYCVYFIVNCIVFCIHSFVHVIMFIIWKCSISNLCQYFFADFNVLFSVRVINWFVYIEAMSVGWDVKWCPVSRITINPLGTQNTVSLNFDEE